jgi:hypothetical protein
MADNTYNREADQQMQALVDAAAIRHPDMGLSWGYVGNLGPYGRDDRSWRILTNKRDTFGHSISYCVFDMAAAVQRLSEPGVLDAWIDMQRKKAAP